MLISMTYTVGHYSSQVFKVEADSEAEALCALSAFFKEREGSRLPTPAVSFPLHVEFSKDPID